MVAHEVVVDASLVLNFALPGHPYHAQARQFLVDGARTGALLLAPPLYEAEVDSVLRRLQHLHVLTVEAGTAAQMLVDALPVQIVYDASTRVRARQIAQQLDQSRVYDATYAALADLRGCELWTGDERFHQAAKEILTLVRFLGNYPG